MNRVPTPGAMYRGRFAPSPTGDLHLGSALTAMVARARAHARRGRLVLRVEDLDTSRVVIGSEARQLEDLRWLGVDWDEGPDIGGPAAPYRQSQRTHLYQAAIARLAADGRVYWCDCSRKEIASIASAPHLGEDGPRYPGTCREFGMRERNFRRPPSVRLLVPDGDIEVDDAIQGPIRQNVGDEVGDFVLRRGDGVFAYQLAVVVDDLAMGITEVVRGVDLLASAPRQVLLAHLLGGSAPRFAHVPLLVDVDGSRLAKREPRRTLRGLRDLGHSPDELRRQLISWARSRDGAAGMTPAGDATAWQGADVQPRRELRLPPPYA